ncbi:MAG: discoidin domain-containing protein [Coriobacteriia bacterium]|nr:discoidin domain-containing protein [Coriobacteriia bacterium]
MGAVGFLSLPHAARADVAADAQLRSAESAAANRVRATELQLPYWAFTYYTRDNAWITLGPDGWTSGYLPGELWRLYALRGDGWFRTHANTRLAPIARHDPAWTELDIGIRYFYSCASDYDLTGDAAARSQALVAANSMAIGFNPAAGVVSPASATNTATVIIDDLMNVQLLWWAADHGGSPVLRSVANAHTLTTARDFVRADGSTYQFVSYETSTGAVVDRGTRQGCSDDSTWSRGQAWAIHGFANGYRETHNPVLLAAARKVADWYLAHLPDDMVPYWDFEAPDIPNAPRDSSAAAVAASGLIDLSMLDPDVANRTRYEAAARATLQSLSSPNYLSTGPNPAVLLHGTMSYSAGSYDVGQSFGDYFYLEALQRLRRLTPAQKPWRIVRTVASSGSPSRAIDRSESTSWTSKGKQWIDVKLERRTTVSAVGVGVRWGASRSATLKVQVSYDRKHWRTVRVARSGGDWAGVETYRFTPSRTRWVRLAVSGTSHNSANGITMLRVY